MTRQQKIAWLAPLVVVPFLTLLAWAAGVGKGSPSVDATTPSGSNTTIPKPTVRPSTNKTKLDYYNQAWKDSITKRSPRPVDSLAPIAAHIQESLLRIQTAMGPRPGLGGAEPGPHPSTAPPSVWPAPKQPPPLSVPMMRPQPPVPVPDPDLEKYDRLLDKIMEIQHPESAKPKEALVTPQHPVPDTLAAIQAQIDADAALVSGETIALRLEEPLRIEGKQVDSSTLVYGMVNLQGERLHIQIRSILIGRKILAVHLEAYDQDGQLGIYVPGSLERDVAKESTEGSIGTLNMDLADPGLGAQAANAGLQAAKSLLSRKVRQVRVFVRAGYQVFIK